MRDDARMTAADPTLESEVRRRVAEDWGLAHASIERHDAGMNSRTWLVTSGASRWIAKAVPAATQPGFVGGLRVAELVERAGIPAGAPVATVDGRLTAELDGHALALLSYVAGDQLLGESDDDHRWMGSVLGRIHRALLSADLPGAERFHWVDPQAQHLGIRPWIRPAVEAALDALDTTGLTMGLLHTDPAPEAFRLDSASGICGLIDWDRAMVGPLLYDLASAVLYVGGPERAGTLVEAYLDQGVVGRDEVDRGMLPMLRFRWAVQADYFARRIATDDLTGIADPSENEKGLEDSRRALADERLLSPS
jgi:Ser/Thr protein kinase RdoA (MazF antagonist)